MARSERRVSERDSKVVDAAHAPHEMAATASTTMSAIISDLDVDDTGQPEPSDDRQHRSADQTGDPQKVVHERLQVRRLDQPDRKSEQWRHQAQHDRRESTFGREGAQLAAYPFPLEHGVAHRVEQDGEVATDLA